MRNDFEDIGERVRNTRPPKSMFRLYTWGEDCDHFDFMAYPTPYLGEDGEWHSEPPEAHSGDWFVGRLLRSWCFGGTVLHRQDRLSSAPLGIGLTDFLLHMMVEWFLRRPPQSLSELCLALSASFQTLCRSPCEPKEVRLADGRELLVFPFEGWPIRLRNLPPDLLGHGVHRSFYEVPSFYGIWRPGGAVTARVGTKNEGLGLIRCVSPLRVFRNKNGGVVFAAVVRKGTRTRRGVVSDLEVGVWTAPFDAVEVKLAADLVLDDVLAGAHPRRVGEGAEAAPVVDLGSGEILVWVLDGGRLYVGKPLDRWPRMEEVVLPGLGDWSHMDAVVEDGRVVLYLSNGRSLRRVVYPELSIEKLLLDVPGHFVSVPAPGGITWIVQTSRRGRLRIASFDIAQEGSPRVWPPPEKGADPEGRPYELRAEGWPDHWVGSYAPWGPLSAVLLDDPLRTPPAIYVQYSAVHPAWHDLAFYDTKRRWEPEPQSWLYGVRVMLSNTAPCPVARVSPAVPQLPERTSGGQGNRGLALIGWNMVSFFYTPEMDPVYLHRHVEFRTRKAW